MYLKCGSGASPRAAPEVAVLLHSSQMVGCVVEAVVQPSTKYRQFNLNTFPFVLWNQCLFTFATADFEFVSFVRIHSQSWRVDR